MRPYILLSAVVASLLAFPKVASVKPLNNTEEFLVGTFRVPPAPPIEGPVPDRLDAMPRDRCALPKTVWLRFENFGAERYHGWSAQMQIDDQGNIYLVTHLGDATPEKVKAPSWPDKPTQKLDPTTLSDLRKEAAALAIGPPYRGHQGLPYAPTFVVTLRIDQAEKVIVLEGYENDFISRLRRITLFAHGSQPDKPTSKQPARKP